jgi:NCS1 family nucleobase:cation symporter-1
MPYTVQFTLASTIYFTLSRLFPAHETMLDHAIMEQEAIPYDGSISGSDEKKVDVYRVDG